MVGVPFLDKVPVFAATHASAALVVEWAPTADLTDVDGSGWTWVDISSDVRQSNNRTIDISPMGKSDAASQVQPAGCTFQLDNTSGNYSKGPQSTYYPNVKLNVPVRISITLNGLAAGKVTRFQGYIWSLRPSWDSTGRDAVVTIQASGITRRLAHGVPTLRSALYRAYTVDTDIVAYWPMEDASGATELAQAARAGQTMTFTDMNLSTYSDISGSGDLPTFESTSDMNAYISYDFSGNWEVEWLINVPSAPAADTAVLRIHTGGSQISRYEIVFASASTTAVSVIGYNNNATVNFTDTVLMGSALPGGSTIGVPLSCRFFAQQNGTATDYELDMFRADAAGFGGGGAANSGSIAATTVGDITQISFLPAAGMNGVSMGHVAVLNDFGHAFPDEALIGYYDPDVYSETPYGRVNRLCTEEGVDFDPVSTSGSEEMGAQGTESLMTLLRQSEEVSQGILWDGQGPGISWRDRQDIENQEPTLTLVTTDVMPDFEPNDDDQDIVNRMTVTRTNGGSATYDDTDSSLSVTEIGIYQNQISSLNIGESGRLRDYASWSTHVGTVEGYRYPRIELDMRKIPSKASSWLNTFPGGHVRLEDIENYVTQLPNGDIELLMLGYTERLSRFVWSVTMNCAPYLPWQTGEMDNASNSFATLAGNLDTDNSTLNTTAVLGATSISVATTGSNLWSTVAADKSIDISVGGWRVSCSAISGASSPQTFTISALPAGVTAGAEIGLWAPSYLSL